jgi:hypothetical protein
MIRKLDFIWVCLWLIGMFTITEFDGPKYNEHEDNDLQEGLINNLDHDLDKQIE